MPRQRLQMPGSHVCDFVNDGVTFFASLVTFHLGTDQAGPVLPALRRDTKAGLRRLANAMIATQATTPEGIDVDLMLHHAQMCGYIADEEPTSHFWRSYKAASMTHSPWASCEADRTDHGVERVQSQCVASTSSPERNVCSKVSASL